MFINRSKIVQYIQTVKEFLSSSKGRDILLYLVFVAISFVFWMVLTLNKVTQESFRVSFNLSGVPDNVTIVSDYPKEFFVTVKNNGYSLFKYALGRDAEITADFKDFDNGKGELLINNQEMADLFRSCFGADATIVGSNPQNLSVKYTTLPGKRVPVVIKGEYAAHLQYVVNGRVGVIPDSVTIYSDAITLNATNVMETEKFVMKELTDTVLTTLALKKVKDVKIVPDSVRVIIPVEPLVGQKSSIPVVITNLPENVRMVVFPSRVSVSYLLPISQYGNVIGKNEFEAVVDFNNITKGSDKLPVHLGKVPASLRNVRLELDSVEYIIEH